MAGRQGNKEEAKGRIILAVETMVQEYSSGECALGDIAHELALLGCEYSDLSGRIGEPEDALLEAALQYDTGLGDAGPGAEEWSTREDLRLALDSFLREHPVEVGPK